MRILLALIALATLLMVVGALDEMATKGHIGMCQCPDLGPMAGVELYSDEYFAALDSQNQNRGDHPCKETVHAVTLAAVHEKDLADGYVGGSQNVPNPTTGESYLDAYTQAIKDHDDAVKAAIECLNAYHNPPTQADTSEASTKEMPNENDGLQPGMIWCDCQDFTPISGER
ncbi:MAG: hypothetical protein M0Q43_11255 [Methanothrix sp.]|jgi:hypothetical protein|nr:hypothetical protein [Methanothrix sp.]